jgi:putative peptidoglycan lipid II flippase
LEALLGGCRAWVGSDDWKGIAELAMWMAPGLFFICMYGLNCSLLQCEKKYFLPAAAPVAFNLLWILAVGITWHLPKEEAVRWLAIAVTGAFGAQWLATAPAVKKVLAPRAGKREFFSLDWKKLLKPLTLGTLGVGAVQLNSALDAIFARLADPEGPAFLWYAIRIEQLPLALFGLALSGALLPPLARALQAGNFDRYRELLQSALKQSAALMLFCTFGIFALGGVGINFLYGHGDFSPADVQETLRCLWAYGAGLVPSVFVLLLAAGFYAQKSYRIPTFAALLSVAFHAALNAFLIFALHLGAVSIALSTSLAAILNAALLARGLKNAVGEIFPASLIRFLARSAVGFAFPGFLAWSVGVVWLGGEFTRSFAQQTTQFFTLSALYIGGAFLSVRMLKLGELWNLLTRVSGNAS